MLDDIIDVVELVLDGIFGIRKLRKELDNDLISLLQQAHEGKTLSASLIDADALTPEFLRCPLTHMQISSMRACTQVTQQRYSLDVKESKGWRNPHIVVLVTVDFEGVTNTGAPVSIHIDHMPVHFSQHKEKMYVIDDVSAHALI